MDFAMECRGYVNRHCDSNGNVVPNGTLYDTCLQSNLCRCFHTDEEARKEGFPARAYFPPVNMATDAATDIVKRDSNDYLPGCVNKRITSVCRPQSECDLEGTMRTTNKFCASYCSCKPRKPEDDWTAPTLPVLPRSDDMESGESVHSVESAHDPPTLPQRSHAHGRASVPAVYRPHRETTGRSESPYGWRIKCRDPLKLLPKCESISTCNRRGRLLTEDWYTCKRNCHCAPQVWGEGVSGEELA
ncbi:hypothetical protein B0T14DRAFT_524215 [Immersiella caudata]|uniref:Uncharacterized protein n=1 Tax=Immersiella caudata TaxID=314043 RepID=A0AA40BXB6_9PEZI|nr:hypothetical protein B0T14DRAFT_524215 [Immersiella caudata]